MSLACRICGNAEGNKDYLVKEMMFGFRDTFNYYQCAKCGCLQIAEIPQDMSKYYPADYYSFRHHQNAVKDFIKRLRYPYALYGKGIVGRVLLAVLPIDNVAVVLHELARVHIQSESKIVDVGCGSGELLYELRNMGFKNLYGIDRYVPAGTPHSNGLEIVGCSLRDAAVSGCDLVMFNHSFEHMEEPADTLAIVHGMLRDGGVCFIRMPTVSSYAWQRYGVHWMQIDAPRHFFVHSVESIRMLASQVGFVCEDIVYDSTEAQFVGSEQYQKGILVHSEMSYFKHPRTSIFSANDIRSFKRKAVELNAMKQGDSIAVYLRK